MDVVTGKELSRSLRNACDSVRHRLWIASPYVGGWESVRRLIGRRWWDDTQCKVRLLTDLEEGGLNGATAQRLAQRGPVHSLRGLHAKVYIVDDLVLLTSANLTGTAFSKRYEAGVWLRGALALEVIKQYEDWWDNQSERLKADALALVAKSRRREAGEDEGTPLDLLNPLPSDVGDLGGSKFVNIFLDYPRFLDDYKTFAREYVAVQRIWPKVPVYFEVDGFLDYLFRKDECLSKPFEENEPRDLSDAVRRREIRRLAHKFKDWANQQEGNGGRWLLTRSNLVRRLLSKRNIGAITRSQIREVVEILNCMGDGRQRSRFLNSPKNSTIAVRRAWTDLLYGKQPDTERMSLCAGYLFSFKRSSVQELLGFFSPNDYPLRNATVNAGLRFFGFDVRAH